MAEEKNVYVKTDYREATTSKIIELLEQSADLTNSRPRPINILTNKEYIGANAIYLHLRANELEPGGKDPRWYSFNQAEKEGFSIKKGSKATTVEFWQTEKKEKIVDENGIEHETTIKLEKPQVRYAKLFHASQLDRVPRYFKDPLMPSTEQLKAYEYVQQRENQLQDKKEHFHRTALEAVENMSPEEKAAEINTAKTKVNFEAKLKELYLQMDKGFVNQSNTSVINEELSQLLKEDKDMFFKVAYNAEKASLAIAKRVDIIENYTQEMEQRLDNIKNADFSQGTDNLAFHEAYYLEAQKQLNNNQQIDDVAIVAEMLVSGKYEPQYIESVAALCSPNVPIDPDQRDEYSRSVFYQGGDKEEIQERLNKILTTEMPEDTKSLTPGQSYIVEAQKQLKDNPNLPINDHKIAAAMYLQGHIKLNIISTVFVHTTFPIKTDEQRKAYAKNVVTNALTPEIVKQAKQNKQMSKAV